MVESAASALSAERPFPGLRPFAYSDHAFFYGRKAQFYELHSLVDLNPFVAVVGSSGSGKSSLVRAGLLPLLQEETDDAGGRRWRWIEMRPGDAPMEQLTRAMVEFADTVAPIDGQALAAARAERIAYHLRSDSSGISAALEEIEGLAGTSLLILVDQFEELFRFAGAGGLRPESRDSGRSREEATNFVQLLLAASRAGSRDLHVLLTMRSDFIGDCARFQGLPEAVSATQFLVPSLTRDQREQVIRGPLRKASATIDSALVERLLNDGNDEEDQLPVLQHCLLRLWERAGAAPVAAAQAPGRADGAPPSSRHIALAHYESIGGMARALSEHASEILASLPVPEISVEQAFRALSEIDKEGRATRRALLFGQLVAETGIPERDLRVVIDRFRADDCSFLTPSPSAVAEIAAGTRVDVGHEALLRRWERVSGQPGASGEGTDPRPIGWLKEEVRDGRRYQALLSLVEGDASGRTTLPLDQVVRRRTWWNERPRTPAWTERYGGGHARVMRLIEDSSAALAADELRKRQEEQRAQEENQRKARRERMTLAAAAAFFLLFVAAVFAFAWAYNASREARDNLKIAVGATNTLTDSSLTYLSKGQMSTAAAYELLRKAEKSFEELKSQARSQAPEIVAANAVLLLTASDILAELGRSNEILQRAERAEALAKQLAAAGHKNGRSLLYESKFRIADVVVHTDRAAALETFRDAQAIMRQLHGEEPQNGGWAYKLAFITNKVGETLEAGGDFQSAQEQFAIALRIADENAARPSAQAAWRAYPAITRTKIGSLLLARPDRDLPGAMKNFDEAIASLENVHRSFPDNNVIQSNLKRAHQSKAEALAGVGSPTEAFKELDVAAEIGKQLADKDPGNATWMVGLADVAIIYGDLKKDGDPGFASGQFETAASIYRRLLNRDACNPSWREKFEDVRKRLKALEKDVSSLGAAPMCFQAQ